MALADHRRDELTHAIHHQGRQRQAQTSLVLWQKEGQHAAEHHKAYKVQSKATMDNALQYIQSVHRVSLTFLLRFYLPANRRANSRHHSCGQDFIEVPYAFTIPHGNHSIYANISHMKIRPSQHIDDWIHDDIDQ